jgi:hypothetical protein
VTTFGKLDGLRDRGVGRHTRHEQQLRRAQSKEVEQVGVEADSSTANACVEVCIDACPSTQRSVDELTNPASIARVESASASIERRIEHLASAQVGADFGGGNACVSNGAGMVHDDASRTSTSASTAGRSAVLIRPWHTS